MVHQTINDSLSYHSFPITLHTLVVVSSRNPDGARPNKDQQEVGSREGRMLYLSAALRLGGITLRAGRITLRAGRIALRPSVSPLEVKRVLKSLTFHHLDPLWRTWKIGCTYSPYPYKVPHNLA